MQLIPRYLVNNRTTAVVNDAGFITEYRPVYTRQLQVYRGIENKVEFKLLNADQKAKSLTGYTARFVAFDEKKNLVIETVGVPNSSITGLFTVTLTESDLINIEDQFLKYNVYLETAAGEKTITYSSAHFENSGTMKVSSEAFPGAKESISVTSFTKTPGQSNEWLSNNINAEPEINGNTALHTAVYYTTGYVGNIEIQATLDNGITNSTAWTTISTTTFTGSETITPLNFNGVYTYIRFKTDADPASTVTKILLRN